MVTRKQFLKKLAESYPPPRELSADQITELAKNFQPSVEPPDGSGITIEEARDAMTRAHREIARRR